MVKTNLSIATRSMKSSMIRELVASTRDIPGLISFAGGFPSPKTFPREILSRIYNEVVDREGMEVLQYGASEGDSILKTQLNRWEDYDLDPDKLLITAGATNAIYYMALSLIDPGDVIICEAPSFLGSLVAFDAIGADVQTVPLDREGLDINALQLKVDNLRARGKRIKFIYTIPDFQNPAGLTMSLQRRKNLIEYAIAEDILILEDNPYSRLRFSGEALPTMFRIAARDYHNTDIVTEIVSFSKILGPGMRLAYAKGNKELINRMGSWQQKVNITPDCISQRVASRFLEEGFMEPHIESICTFYKPYLDKMLNCMMQHLPPYIQYSKPEGGIFTWLWLPEDMNADDLFEKAKQYKVTFIPGSKFYPVGQERFNCLRLNFTYSTFEQIESGICSLGKLMNEFYV